MFQCIQILTNTYRVTNRVSLIKHVILHSFIRLDHNLPLKAMIMCSADVETNAGSQRVLVETYDPTVNSWDPATYCNPTSGPGQEEYHVMVKAGKQDPYCHELLFCCKELVL